MQLDKKHIEFIRKEFQKLESKQDLLNLLNYAKPLIYGPKTYPFKLNVLTWYAHPQINKFLLNGKEVEIDSDLVSGIKKRYNKFIIKKKTGGVRTIHAPAKSLKVLQKTLSLIFQCVFEPHKAAMGFTIGKSIVDNAKLHVGNNYVYNIDLKDFFQSIDQARVWKCFQLNPFNLNGFSASRSNVIEGYDRPFKDIKINQRIIASGELPQTYDTTNPELENDERFTNLIKLALKKHKTAVDSKGNIANMLAAICCIRTKVERKNEDNKWETVFKFVLPQGAPTSPVITNIVCQKLDRRLFGLAKRFGLKYSRYADDITFSSMHNVYQKESDFLNELQRIIIDQGFHIKESKTRLQKVGYRQEVTGLLVNEKANVQQRYIKQLRMWLYYWERYGYEKAYRFFLQIYIADKGHVKKGRPNMENVISGKLDYLKMVKGNENQLYLKLKARFDHLTGKSIINSQVDNESIIKEIIQTPVKTFLQEPTTRTIKTQSFIISAAPPKIKPSLPIMHNPKELVTLLKNFSVNDSALKYTTHSWDAGRDANMFRDVDEFLQLAENQYNNFSYQLYSLNRNLHAKIYYFLFNKNISKDGWGDLNPKKRIRFGWSSPELLEACRLDASLNPEDFILPHKYQLQRGGKTLQKFKHVIDAFKNEIEIRDENSALLNLILQKHDQFLMSFADPIISNLENKTFYTDVQWISKALDMIFENIQNRPQHRQVCYSVNDKKEDSYQLEILHSDSFNIGKSIYDEKLQLVKGNFGDICEYLKNLCDWSIESQFAEGYYRINYLTSNTEEVSHQRLEAAEGFKHILTFYK